LPSSFSNKKELRFVITLATGTFGSSSNNQVTLDGLRATVDIDNGGGQMNATLRAKIYGVTQSDMNQVTTPWGPRLINRNTILVYALDGPQETLVFAGDIVNAWGNYQSMPDVFLEIQAQAGLINQLQPVAPTSYKGTVDVATAMRHLAESMGYTFENNGVAVPLSNPYVANTGMEQVKTLAKAAGITWGLDKGVLFICPPNTPRGSLIPTISAKTGMIGYPTYDAQGINIKSLFNPAIVYHGAFTVSSSVPRPQGTLTAAASINPNITQWIAFSIAHRLESEKPGGAWFSTVRGNPSGFAISS
jgi:hypothetical protein